MTLTRAEMMKELDGMPVEVRFPFSSTSQCYQCMITSKHTNDLIVLGHGASELDSLVDAYEKLDRSKIAAAPTTAESVGMSARIAELEMKLAQKSPNEGGASSTPSRLNLRSPPKQDTP